MGTAYGPLRLGNFTETITGHFSKINTNNTKIYILGDFDINLLAKQNYISHQTNTQSLSSEAKNFVLCMVWNN